MKKLAFNLDGNALQSIEPASDYVDVRSLAAGVAKSFAKPVGSTTIAFLSNFAVGESISFGDDLSSAPATLTAVAASPTASQFVPLATLAITLAALVIQLQALGNVPTGTYTVTGTSITLTNATASRPTRASALKVDAVAVTQVTGARFCRLSAGQLFYYAVSGVATTGATDVSNGTGSISVPATVQPWFCVDDVSSISVIAPAAIAVSAEWWA